MKWQPIETAPKDGSEILAARRKRRSETGKMFICRYVNGEWWGKGAYPLNEQPTLWFRVPNIPLATAGE